MNKVTVKLPSNQPANYTICIGAGAIAQITSLYDFGRYSKAFVIADQAVEKPLLERLVAALPIAAASLVLPISEQGKNIDSVQRIWTAMHEAGCDRKALVINLGGGVVGDIGGFAASTYMRGVDFLNVPTTLLAQVDASAGGKTGFNFGGVKNLIGTFSQPVGVVIDTLALKALPEREFLSGFAEIIKHGLIQDASYFEQVTAKPPLEFSPDELAEIITRSCQIKADIVQADETESGARKLLNYGHTVGHAVEALSHQTDKPLLHGEAISIGMRAEAIIANRLGKLSGEDLGRLEQALVKAGLQVVLHDTDDAALTAKMRSDKKNDRGNVNFTLLDAIGRAVYNQQVEESVITEALQAARQEP